MEQSIIAILFGLVLTNSEINMLHVVYVGFVRCRKTLLNCVLTGCLTSQGFREVKKRRDIRFA